MESVVTVGAILAVAAHLEGKGCSELDVTGLAQKNGAVSSHVRIAHDPSVIFSSRIGVGAGKTFEFKDLSAEHKAAILLGMRDGLKKVEEKAATIGKSINGWSVGSAFGDRDFYKGDWLLRAAAGSEPNRPCYRGELMQGPAGNPRRAFFLLFCRKFLHKPELSPGAQLGAVTR